MKKCPACKSTYTDESLVYCLQDGVPLEDEGTAEEAKTVIRRVVPGPTTVAFNSEPKTDDSSPAHVSTSASPGNSKTIIAILATVLVMLMLFSIIGVGTYLYFGRGSVSDRTSSNQQEQDSNRDTDIGLNPDNVAAPESKSKTDAKPTSSPTAGPVETPDPEQISEKVSAAVNDWVSLAESRNLSAYMKHYGQRVDYYNKKAALRSFVQGDKRKAFEKYTTIQIRISGLVVTPSKDGLTAAAVFDKQWLFVNQDVRQTGKVRTRLVFRKSAGGWKIVSERDTKVYYVNK